MTIRPALPADFAPIYAIWLAGIAHSFAGFAHPADLREQFEHNFSSCRPPFGFWVAEEAGQVLGFQSLLPCTSNPLKRHLLAKPLICYDHPPRPANDRMRTITIAVAQ